MGDHKTSPQVDGDTLFLWGPGFTVVPHRSSNGAQDLATQLKQMADQLLVTT